MSNEEMLRTISKGDRGKREWRKRAYAGHCKCDVRVFRRGELQ